MPRFVRADGLCVAALGDGWVGYSPLSGESHLLNHESVAVLEALGAVTPRTDEEVALELSADLEMAPAELRAILHDSWNSLVEAGLVREVAGMAHP